MAGETGTSGSSARPSAGKRTKGRAAASISERNRLILWTRSGGRCQYVGCNADLLGDIVSGTKSLNRAYIAHIIAAAPDGPRGDPVRSPLLADNIENLMLLCDTHHRLIDRDKAAEHPEQMLLDMKRHHEMRVANVLSVNPVQTSHAIRYAARIGALESPVAQEVIFRDMLPEVHPAGWRPIDIELVGSQFTDEKPEYWNLQRDNPASSANRMAPPSPLFLEQAAELSSSGCSCERNDEEPKPGTLGQIYRTVAAMPRLAAAVHARQPAEVLDERRVAARRHV
jgi:hypothetical protein